MNDVAYRPLYGDRLFLDSQGRGLCRGHIVVAGLGGKGRRYVNGANIGDIDIAAFRRVSYGYLYAVRTGRQRIFAYRKGVRFAVIGDAAIFKGHAFHIVIGFCDRPSGIGILGAGGVAVLAGYAYGVAIAGICRFVAGNGYKVGDVRFARLYGYGCGFFGAIIYKPASFHRDGGFFKVVGGNGYGVFAVRAAEAEIVIKITLIC